MANTLSPAEWKKILKDHKDAPDTADVTKALDAYAKVEPKAKDAPQPVLDALSEVVDAAKSAKSANARDKKRKPVVDFLDDVLKDASTMKVKVERLLQEKNERDREGEDEDEGGADEVAKLTERLIKVKKLDAEAAKPFVLALGGKSHGLVIGKTNALSGDHKKRARAMREGNGRIFIGRVFGENGKYVFAMAVKPPGGLAKALKKTALKHTKLPPIRVIVRGPDGVDLDDETDVEELADLGSDTEESEETETETVAESSKPEESPGSESAIPTAPEPPSSEEKERFSAKVKELTPRIRQALTAGGPFVDQIAERRDAILQLGGSGQFGDALAELAKLEELLDKAAAPGEDQGPGASTLRRIEDLKPRVKELLTAKAPNAREVGLAFSEAQALARQGDFGGAEQRLDDVEVALGGTVAPRPTEKTPEGDQQQAFDDRLKAVSADVLIYLRANPDDRADMTDLLRSAKESAGTGAFAVAHTLLDRVDRIVIEAQRKARALEMGEQIPEGAGVANVVNAARVEAIATEWTRARMAAVTGATALAATLRDSPYEDVQPIASLVDELVDEFPRGLDATLEELRSAIADGDTPTIKKFQSRGKKDVRECLDYLNAKTNLIAACEQNPLGGPPVSIAAPLKQSLKTILDILK